MLKITIFSGPKKHQRQLPEVFLKNSFVFKNYAPFSGKHLCWILFLIKIDFIKKRLQQRCFPMNIAKFLKNTLFEENLQMTASETP